MINETLHRWIDNLAVVTVVAAAAGTDAMPQYRWYFFGTCSVFLGAAVVAHFKRRWHELEHEKMSPGDTANFEE